MDFRYLAGGLLLGCPLILHANDTDMTATGAAQPQELGSVVVTATRTPRPRSATLAPTTVITREDIKRVQARSVHELLRLSPGISAANQGGPGKLTSVFMRGAESDHLLVLVNGVRYGDATSGLAAIQDLPVEQIERIEIVRGPRSSLYGSEAIGGVIQIFTRDGSGERGPYFSVGGGRYDTYEGQVGMSGGNERTSYDVSLSGTESDGFNACDGRPFGAPGGGAGCFTNEPDDDPYSRLSGSMRIRHRLANGLLLKAHALRTEGDNEFDGTTTNQSDTVRQVYGVSAAGRPVEPWHVELSLGRSRDVSDDYLNGTFVSEFETVRDTASLQNDVAVFGDDLVTFGLDYRRVQVASTTAYNETRRDNAGAFLQYLGTWGDHELQLAARGDDNEQFGEHATGSATWGWGFTEAHTVTFSYGTAFKAPNFNELYFPGFANPELEPEESRSAELGLIGNREWGRWSLHAFETRIDELIASSADTGFIPENISETRLRGVEGEVGAAFGAWQLNANATWLDAENRSDTANEGNELPRRPEYTAQLDVDRRIGRYSAGISLFVAGSRFDDQANTRKLDGYELVDLRGEMHLKGAWRIQARLSNLFGQDYQTVAFFNQPGRSLFVTLRYQP